MAITLKQPWPCPLEILKLYNQIVLKLIEIFV